MARSLGLFAAGGALVGLTLLWSSTALSGYSSMSCGNRIVSVGDTTYTVKSTCGEPDAQDRRVEQRSVRRVVRGPCRPGGSCSYVEEETVEVVLEQWTYDFGKNRFVEYAFFEDGHLTNVETGSYGTK